MNGKSFLAALGIFGFVLVASAQAGLGKGVSAVSQAARDNKTVFLLFYRDRDAATDAMAAVVKANADKHAAKATWSAVQVNDPAERSLVERYKLSRAPMPLVLAVHPYGVVTGAFPKKADEAGLAQCLISPKEAECMQLLQQNQLVLLCVQSSPQQAAPQGVRDFQADPQFSKRTKVVTVQVGDGDEAEFLEQLKIAPNTATPLTVFMAPPGVMVGTFPATTSMQALAKALHAASKCCDDENCKHPK